MTQCVRTELGLLCLHFAIRRLFALHSNRGLSFLFSLFNVEEKPRLTTAGLWGCPWVEPVCLAPMSVSGIAVPGNRSRDLCARTWLRATLTLRAELRWTLSRGATLTAVYVEPRRFERESSNAVNEIQYSCLHCTRNNQAEESDHSEGGRSMVADVAQI